MADLLWDDVKCFFDPDVMGSLPDVRIPNTSVEDWQAVLDFVVEKGWKCKDSEGGAVLPVPRAEAANAERKKARLSCLFPRLKGCSRRIDEPKLWGETGVSGEVIGGSGRCCRRRPRSASGLRS